MLFAIKIMLKVETKSFLQLSTNEQTNERIVASDAKQIYLMGLSFIFVLGMMEMECQTHI